MSMILLHFITVFNVLRMRRQHGMKGKRLLDREEWVGICVKYYRTHLHVFLYQNNNGVSPVETQNFASPEQKAR